MTAREWAKELGIGRETLHRRLRDGLSPEEAFVGAKVENRSRQEEWPGARDLPFSEDVRAQELVREQGAIPSSAVARIMGMSRQRIDQYERKALKKLARILGADTKQTLQALEAMRSEVTWPEPWGDPWGDCG
jgi:hypothetical protein